MLKDMLYLVKRNFRCLFDLLFSQSASLLTLSDCCREKFGMSNLSHSFCRASPCTMRDISKHSCCLCEKLFKVFYEWQERAETESLNSCVSVVSFVFQNRVSCRFLTVPKLSSLLSFNFIKPAVTNKANKTSPGNTISRNKSNLY